MLTIGTETAAFMKPHTTVVVRGDGGFVQNVPWNVPANGDVQFGDVSMFGAFGLTEDEKQKLAVRVEKASNLARGPDIPAVRDILSVVIDGAERRDIALKAIALGGDAAPINRALADIDSGVVAQTKFLGVVSTPFAIAYGIASVLSIPVSAYHGFRRNNDSVLWGVWWGFMGALFPIITPTVAVLLKPGFAKPKTANFGRLRRRYQRRSRS